MHHKKRLDHFLKEKYPDWSKQYIQSIIMQGLVKVSGSAVTKPGTAVADDAAVTVEQHEQKYVSRAGFKLEKAVEHFGIKVKGLVALDAGLSTGGFTDCLLQQGASKVYGVDVGYGQVHEKIRGDPRVVVLERTNLRYLEQLPESVDLVTLDLSFISVLKVMDVVCRVLKSDGALLVLIKPQFEAERGQTRGGIIKDPVIHEQVTRKVVAGIGQYGFRCIGVIPSPIEGAAGNKEFLAYFLRNI